MVISQFAFTIKFKISHQLKPKMKNKGGTSGIKIKMRHKFT